MRGKEHVIQAAFFCGIRFLAKLDPRWGWIYAIPNGGARTLATGKLLKAEGVRAGVWDVFVPVKIGDHGGLYIEFKADKNTLTTEQKEFGRVMYYQRGYLLYIAYSSQDATDAVQRYFMGVTVAGVGQVEAWLKPTEKRVKKGVP